MNITKNINHILIIFLISLFTSLFSSEVSFNHADYLVVVHEDLYSANWKNTLVNLKHDQGLDVGVQIIYDDESIHEIKTYISTAYNTGNKPQYLLLVGDASNYHPEQRLLVNADAGNYIPTFYEDYPSNLGFSGVYSRDDWYGCLVSDYNEVRGYAVDYFPELYVGRIPAESLTEVNTYIEKLELYSSITTGEWRDDILFVSGNIDNSSNGCRGSIVEHMVENVAKYEIYDGWEKSYVWTSDYEPLEREAAFESAVNSGASIINAFGTGAHWTNLVDFYFDDSDYSFDNNNELAFLIGASCNIGEFHAYDTRMGTESQVVVEKLMFNTGGIIAAFVPASATIQEGNGKIAEHLYWRIFNNTIIRLGEAITSAKRDLTSTAHKFIFMGKSFNLLGDPAMDLVWPYSKVNFQSRIACDNKFEFYLNNKLMSSGDNWQNAEFYQIDFEHGENVIAIKGIDQGGAAGLLVDIDLPMANKHLVSDETWKCDTEYSKYWTSPKPRFKEIGWVNVTKYGQYGVAPWYSNVSGMGTTDAKWIWSADKYNDNIVYFRKNIFYEDFDNNRRYKAWLKQGGIWNLENEEFSVEYTYGHNFNFAEYVNLASSDLLYDLEFTVDINKKTSSRFQPGIAFRSVDKNNGYVFMVNGYGSRDWIQLYKVVNGAYYRIGVNNYWDDDNYRLDQNTWYTLKVEAQGDTIKGKVWLKSQNEPEAWHVIVADNTYGNGKVGLHYCNDHLHFDNVYFTNLPSRSGSNNKNSMAPAYPIAIDKDSLEKYVNRNDIQDEEILGDFYLMNNYPDPFNPTTTISFNLPVKKSVKLFVYDIQGRLVKQLVDGYLNAGKHKIEFTADHLSSGIYFYRLETGNNVQIKKMTLVK